MTAVKPKWADLTGSQRDLLRELLDVPPPGMLAAELLDGDIDRAHELGEMGALEINRLGRITVHTKPPETQDRAAQHNRAQTRADRAHLAEITAWQHQITQVLTQRHNSVDAGQALKRRLAVLDRARQLIEQELTK